MLIVKEEIKANLAIEFNAVRMHIENITTV